MKPTTPPPIPENRPETAERRPPMRIGGPPAPKPAGSGPALRPDWVFRLSIAGLLTVSAALAWWIFAQRLLPLQKQSQELTFTLARVSADVDMLERKWGKEQAEAVTNRLRQAQSRWFGDQATLQTWLSDLQVHADLLDLKIKADFGKVEPQTGNKTNLVLIPATISVGLPAETEEASKESSYQRVLRLSQGLIQHKRVDWSELNVQSGTNSVGSAVLGLALWAGEEKR